MSQGRNRIDDELASKIKEDNTRVHDEEAEVYDKTHAEIFNWYEQRRTYKDVKAIVEVLGIEKPSVLDVGCGTGNLCLKFLNYGCQVSAVDISEKMLDVLARKSQSPHLKMIASDVDAFISNSKERFDVICFSSVLHHLPDYLSTIRTATTLINNGGIVYITHEPLPKSRASLLSSVLGKVDVLLFLLSLKLKRVRIPLIDYTYSDYHCEIEQGIEPQNVVNCLKSEGFGILRYNEYNARKFAVFSVIDDKIIKTRQHFRLIARKEHLN